MSWYLGLSIAYALLGALTLVAVLYTRLSNGIKFSLIIFVSLFYAATYLQLNNMRGWAVPERPEENFKLHWAVIEEPDKAQGRDGVIYLLGQSLGAFGVVDEPPRLYALPFDPELAQQIEEAQTEIEDGQPIEAILTLKAVTPEDDLLEKNDQPEGRSGDQRDADRLVLNYRNIPRPDLPPKR